MNCVLYCFNGYSLLCRYLLSCRCCCCCSQDGVVIGDNVTASHALLCEGVVVGSGATISPGVVLSYGVVVGPRHTVPAYAIVSLCKQITTEVRRRL